ncbi:MAG: hypothetical protein M1830_006816, partial [Pleopsidium flavum]
MPATTPSLCLPSTVNRRHPAAPSPVTAGTLMELYLGLFTVHYPTYISPTFFVQSVFFPVPDHTTLPITIILKASVIPTPATSNHAPHKPLDDTWKSTLPPTALLEDVQILLQALRVRPPPTGRLASMSTSPQRRPRPPMQVSPAAGRGYPTVSRHLWEL